MQPSGLPRGIEVVVKHAGLQALQVNPLAKALTQQVLQALFVAAHTLGVSQRQQHHDANMSTVVV